MFYVIGVSFILIMIDCAQIEVIVSSLLKDAVVSVQYIVLTFSSNLAWRLKKKKKKKTFFMLKPTDPEMCPPNKSKLTNDCKFFHAKHS